MVAETAGRIFILHHSPNSGRRRYPTAPDHVVASARALARSGEIGARRLQRPIPCRHPDQAVCVRREQGVICRCRLEAARLGRP